MPEEISEFVTIKQFLERHRDLISEAALRRYIDKGAIEVAQPGGPKSKIYLRSDALFRLRALPQTGQTSDHGGVDAEPPPRPKTTTPRWKRGR